ncbi:MAG: PspC domain-containing protein [Candidatus Aquicultor sp.]|nr:PspC domain-containing protein [Candidatus Aquicultor sp.]
MPENHLPADEREPGEEKNEEGPKEQAQQSQMGETGTPPGEPRRLYRSRTNRMLGGVAGGIAEHLGVDPTLIRLIWILSIFTGVGIIGYIIAWIIIPENPSREGATEVSQPSIPTKMPGEVGTLIGIVLIGLGIWFLLSNLGLIPAPFFAFLRVVRGSFWPIVLIFVGIIIILATSGRRTFTIETQGKRLYRSRRQRMIAGVAGGIAEYLGTDPTWVRLAWAVLTIANLPAGVVAYIVAAIVIPEEPR